MSVAFSDLVVWLIIGALAGSLAGMVVKAGWEGIGRWTSLGVGLVGAIIGGGIFRLFNIAPGLDSISVSLRDVLAAFIGSLIFLVILWIVRKRRAA
ncbi:GlsB/YeaQ/YmgE family stress response membrane protein [Methyloligella sp. 2.7D]|uniref:GlsB/YeaQ/YmgE family stress response membrane protein n=1 Tax=unclassified Methyloligella TaxID=2625955 RepID=UPI00157DF53B|nr:GlsB/YeaQ/YmgE family stress response membrane protein [Methyloligella sp. GL2]QKP77345.1 GlsB/YeaQ/YmgE family stress response membrane protein [Methyloligella sp. GL2]